MPSIAQLRTGRYAVVQAQIPAAGLVNIGILLEDPETNSLTLRFRRDLDALLPENETDEEDREVLEDLADDLARKGREMGAARLFEYLESSLSGAIRVTGREEVPVEDFERALNRLYLKNVHSNVLEFRTHLPRYSLRAAAGKFLENEAIEEEGWIEAPEDLRLSTDMFVARIAGHSMEPRIPDGALCVFRYGVAGSRNGRLVLAEQRDATGDNRYAVKRYHSEATEAGKSITLESLNRDYPDWPLEPDADSDDAKYRILGEFVRVLD